MTGEEKWINGKNPHLENQESKHRTENDASVLKNGQAPQPLKLEEEKHPSAEQSRQDLLREEEERKKEAKLKSEREKSELSYQEKYNQDLKNLKIKGLLSSILRTAQQNKLEYSNRYEIELNQSPIKEIKFLESEDSYGNKPHIIFELRNGEKRAFAKTAGVTPQAIKDGLRECEKHQLDPLKAPLIFQKNSDGTDFAKATTGIHITKNKKYLICIRATNLKQIHNELQEGWFLSITGTEDKKGQNLKAKININEKGQFYLSGIQKQNGEMMSFEDLKKQNPEYVKKVDELLKSGIDTDIELFNEKNLYENIKNQKINLNPNEARKAGDLTKTNQSNGQPVELNPLVFKNNLESRSDRINRPLLQNDQFLYEDNLATNKPEEKHLEQWDQKQKTPFVTVGDVPEKGNQGLNEELGVSLGDTPSPRDKELKVSLGEAPRPIDEGLKVSLGNTPKPKTSPSPTSYKETTEQGVIDENGVCYV